MSGVEERWVGSPSKSFHFVMFTSVHARKRKKKKKGNGDQGKHHNTWHTRTSARGGFRVNTHTHGTVKGLRALGSGSRGPVLAHTQIQSHTSTVHGTRGHLNTWSQ